MEFRKEMNGIALAMVAGIWASVAVGQGQGPGIEALLLPDPAPAPSAPAAAKVPGPVTAKSAEKAPAPEAAKLVTGKYKIVKEEKIRVVKECFSGRVPDEITGLLVLLVEKKHLI